MSQLPNPWSQAATPEGRTANEGGSGVDMEEDSRARREQTMEESVREGVAMALNPEASRPMRDADEDSGPQPGPTPSFSNRPYTTGMPHPVRDAYERPVTLSIDMTEEEARARGAWPSTNLEAEPAADYSEGVVLLLRRTADLLVHPDRPYEPFFMLVQSCPPGLVGIRLMCLHRRFQTEINHNWREAAGELRRRAPLLVPGGQACGAFYYSDILAPTTIQVTLYAGVTGGPFQRLFMQTGGFF